MTDTNEQQLAAALLRIRALEEKETKSTLEREVERRGREQDREAQMLRRELDAERNARKVSDMERKLLEERVARTVLQVTQQQQLEKRDRDTSELSLPCPFCPPT